MFKKIILCVLLISVIFSVETPTNNHDLPLSDFDRNEIKCLADNIFHEAQGESTQGKMAVAFVTLNRVDDEGFADTICSVIKQPGQFSWIDNLPFTKSKKYLQNPKFKESYKIAHYVYMTHGELDDNTGGALYFHNRDVSPGWNLKKTGSIGNHTFYKRKI